MKYAYVATVRRPDEDRNQRYPRDHGGLVELLIYPPGKERRTSGHNVQVLVVHTHVDLFPEAESDE